MFLDLIASGYCSLDRIIKINNNPTIGKTSIVTNHSHSKIHFGGCNVNVAINLANLNMKAAPILRVGKDYTSSGFKAYLQEHRVICTAVEEINEASTSSTYLIETPSNDHVTIFYPGAMHNDFAKPYRDEWFTNTSCALMTVASMNDNHFFLEKVKKHHLPLFLGMKMDSDAFPKSFLESCLNEVQYLFTNFNEISCICDIYHAKNAKDLLALLPNIKALIITKGKEGSMAFYKEQNAIKEIRVPIVNTNQVIDTVGSGDAYIAGYIYGYIRQYPIKKCMELGSTLASFVIEGIGSTTNSPNEYQLLERYQNHYIKEK